MSHDEELHRDSQVMVPPSFVALYLRPGSSKPTALRAHIAQRHELCEDMAQMLTEQAATQMAVLSVTEHDVLLRVGRGLLASTDVFSPAEARWVLRRLAELLDWPPLPDDALPPDENTPPA
jgi:hypothetical protein